MMLFVILVLLSYGSFDRVALFYVRMSMTMNYGGYGLHLLPISQRPVQYEGFTQKYVP